MTAYLIIGINDKGFPDIREVYDEEPSEDMIDFWRRYGTKVTVAEVRLSVGAYHRESLHYFPIQ